MLLFCAWREALTVSLLEFHPRWPLAEKGALIECVVTQKSFAPPDLLLESEPQYLIVYIWSWAMLCPR